MASIPTVVIVHPKDPDRPRTINADRFRPDKHVLWSDRAIPQPKPPRTQLDITSKTVAQARPLIRGMQDVAVLLEWRSQEQVNDPPRSVVLDGIADQLEDLGHVEGNAPR